MFFDEYEDLTTSIRELEQGFLAYHNASVVTAYYKKYGYTKDLRELIGEEGLVKEAVSAVGRFFTWLKEKVRSLCKKIWKFILKVVDWFLGLFGIQSNLAARCEYNTNRTNMNNVNKSIIRVNAAIRDIRKDTRRADEMIEISYDLDFLKYIVSDDNGNYIEKAIKDVCVDLSDPSGSSLSKFKAQLDRNIDFLRRGCDPSESRPQEYSAQEIYDVFQDVSDDLCVNVAHIATMTANLAELEHLDLSKYEGERGDRLVDDLINQRGTRECASWSCTIHEASYDIPLILKTWIAYQSAIIQAKSKAIRFMQPLVDDVAKAFNKNANLIEERYPIDGDLLRRLSGFFGHTFRLSDIVFTTKDPTTWSLIDRDDKESITLGWCASGTDIYGSTVIYVNYREVRYMIHHNKGLITPAATRVLKTIIHECRHIYDSQTGKQFDDFSVKYEDRVHERRAFKASDIFIIMDRDIRWIEDIIRRIESRYGDK